MSETVFDRIRAASAWVTERARNVSIDRQALEALAQELSDGPPPPAINPAHHYVGEPVETLTFILALDAINFGSGYFPFLEKRPGLSGYFTIATSLKEAWESAGAWDASTLMKLSAEDCAHVTGQDASIPEVVELMGLFSRALNDLGALLEAKFGGDPVRLVEAAEHSSARLLAILAEMPLYRDVSSYDGREVPFYKRAQLTSADLSAVFDGVGYGHFDDLGELTIFADNLVPHVLRRLGVLRYTEDLARRIDAEVPLVAGSPEEVEIRAGALHAVEGCVALLRRSGLAATAQELDYALWTRGQSPEMKAYPRHRACCTYY